MLFLHAHAEKDMTRVAHILLFLLCLQACPAMCGWSYNTAYAEKKKIILRHADRLQGGEKLSPLGRIEEVRSVSGNVVFVHDKILLSCDQATEFLESGIVELRGDIYITDRKLEVSCDKALYNPETEIAELTGNVRSRLIESNVVTRSQRGRIDKPENRIWLYQDALAWQKEQQLSGDSIMVQLRDSHGKKTVESITIRGNAFFTARDTLDLAKQLYHQLSGKTMVVRLSEEKKVTGIDVDSQAMSLYYAYDDDSSPLGVNFSSGNRIVMMFEKGKLDRIKVIGNVEGKQYPNKLRGDPAINLPGFRLRFAERPVF